MCLHAACSGGACVTPSSAEAAIETTDPLFFVNDVGPAAGNWCREETEAYPERSLNDGDVFAPYTWSDGGSPPQVRYNSTDGGSAGDAGLTWGTNDTLYEPGASGYTPVSDSWAATSMSAGLELFVNLTNDASGNGYVGLGGATVGQLHSPSTWSNPTAPIAVGGDISASLGNDGPSAVFDNTNGRFWAVATIRDGTNHLRVWWTDSSCNVFPNNSACLMHTAVLTSSTNGAIKAPGHYTVVVHPAGGGEAMIAFHDASDQIRLLIVSPSSGSLTIDSDTLINSAAPYAANDNCPVVLGTHKNCTDGNLCRCVTSGDLTSGDCRAGTGVYQCARVGGRKVHVVGRMNGTTPVALVAYDGSFTASGTTRFQSFLSVWNVTTPMSAATQVAHWNTTPTGGAQTWNSVVSGGGSTTNAGWFWFGNDGDPCSSQFAGVLSTNNFVSYNIANVRAFASNFPVIVSARSEGMGDYIGGVRHGLVNGHPFATWSLPATTSAACVPCGGQNYQLTVKGVELIE